MSHRSWAVVLTTVAALGAAQAQGLGADPLLPDPARLTVQLGEAMQLGVPGTLRFVGGSMDGVAVAPAATTADTRTPDDHFGAFRLRVKPALVTSLPGFFSFAKVAADAELDVYAWGDETPDGLGADPHWQYRADEGGLRLTQAYGLVAGRWLALQFGLVRAHFGTGMVANAGVDFDPGDPLSQPFGFGREHDRNLRALVSFFPLEPVRTAGRTRNPLALVVAADAVVDDDTANWRDGDRAYQVLAGARLELPRLSALGGALYRSQDYDEGGTTEVWIAAGSAKWAAIEGAHRLTVQGEVAVTSGETTLSQSPVRSGPFDVAAAGAVGRVGYGRSWYDLVFEAGFASGDANPFDDRVRAFTFDREYRVGLLMFAEATRLSNAVTAANVSDPSYRGVPPRGYDTLATGGAVQNAIYLQPRLLVQPLDGLSVAVGYLYGRSHEPVADAFRSGLAGGAPVAWRGKRDAHALGHEIDVAVRWRWQPSDLVALVSGLQFAWFSPGEAFETDRGNAAADQLGLLYHLEARW